MSWWRRLLGGERESEGERAREGEGERERESARWGEGEAQGGGIPAPSPETGEGWGGGAGPFAALAHVGEPGGATEAEAIAAIAAHRDTLREGAMLQALVRGLLRQPRRFEAARLACARLCAERGAAPRAIALCAEVESIDGLMLAAELFAEAGQLGRAVSLIERVLARDIDTPGARERQLRWSRQLGIAPPAQAADSGATIVLPAAPKSAYRLLREVARGGAGAVYEAEEALLGRRVAFKIYHRGAADRAQIEREARVAVELAGPGVVRVFDAEPEGGWIACEWLGRGSLREHLARGDLADLASLAWALPLARALARVHQRGFVHGDLKPANVLLRAPDDPLLADFGICCPAGTTSVAGTPGYVAPERLEGAPSSPRDDVYSFGRILEDVLATTGESPRFRSIAAACLREAPERPSDARELIALWTA